MNEKGKNSRIIIVSLSIAFILVAIIIYILAVNGKFKNLSSSNKNNETTTEATTEETTETTNNTTTTVEEKTELNETKGELKAVVDSEGNPKQTEFVIDGLILIGNRHT